MKCVTCGKEFTPIHFDIFCSDECEDINPKKQQKHCINCFTPLTGKQKLYCSEKCSERQRYIRNDVDIRTKKQQAYRVKLRTHCIEKLGGKCVKCECSNQSALEFNHINGVDKGKRKTTMTILREIRDDKRGDINLLCAVCNKWHYLVKLKGVPDGWTITYSKPLLLG